MAKSFVVELGTPGSTPGAALSLLRNRIKGIDFRQEGHPFAQVGIAYGFHLEQAGDHVGLACRVEMDEAKLDALGHLLTDKQSLFVDGWPVLSAVGP